MQSLSPLHQKKINIVKNTPKLFPKGAFEVALQIHDVPLRFHVHNEEMVKDLYEHYPLSWFLTEVPAEVLDIYWIDNENLGYSNEQWQNENDPECFVLQEGGKKIAVQRDFAATLENKKCFLICAYAIDDGFFNFLRWLLPLQFIEHEQILLHSSCVLDAQKKAYFSLGYSGAGKSTISSYAPPQKILGDDMNVIKIKDGHCWAQAGALGQALLNPKEYANWYPVEALFWLKKGPRVHLEKMSQSTQLKFLMTSVANVFWGQQEPTTTAKLFLILQKILVTTELYELEFCKQEGIWQQIFEQFKIIKKESV